MLDETQKIAVGDLQDDQDEQNIDALEQELKLKEELKEDGELEGEINIPSQIPNLNRTAETNEVNMGSFEEVNVSQLGAEASAVRRSDNPNSVITTAHKKFNFKDKYGDEGGDTTRGFRESSHPMEDGTRIQMGGGTMENIELATQSKASLGIEEETSQKDDQTAG